MNPMWKTGTQCAFKIRMRTSAIAGLFWASALCVTACAVSPAEEAASASAASTTSESTEGDGCDPASERARLEATFERSVDCAADAVGVGLASKVKLAGDAVKDTKKIVDALKAVASRVRVTNVSTARAILCVRAASDILTEQTAKAAIKTAAQGLTEGQIDELWGEVGSTFSFGVSNVFVNAQKLSEVPTFDSLAEFLASFAESAAHLGEFVTTCGSVLREFGVVALPSIARYAERFGTLCVASGIVSCGASLIGNTRDVAKELSCLGKDLDRLREQFAKLQDMNDANCANLGRIAENPSLLPVLRNGGTAQSEALAEVCSQTIRYWGSCVYDARRSGLFGSTRLSCSECERVCTSYVNAAGPNAYLGDVIDGALSRAGGSSQKVRTLVFQASQSCGPNVGPDGLKPCVHFCRGQVADCP